jgi:SAM-dependent methyltransferase
MTSTDSSEYHQFEGVAPYYDQLMQGVPYEKWVQYLEQLIRRFQVEVHTVLDLACGTGNVSEILANRGYTVWGVDISSHMIQAAMEKAKRCRLPIHYEVQDASSLSLSNTNFDLCVCLFDSLNYILDPHNLALTFQNVYDHLRPGGLFIFDINSYYALENGFFDQDNMLDDEPLKYIWKSSFDSSTKTCSVHMRFIIKDHDGKETVFYETHFQHAYGFTEILNMLDSSGFQNIQSFHRYTLRPVNAYSDRIFFACKKPIN